jgi:hypothetical protein
MGGRPLPAVFAQNKEEEGTGKSLSRDVNPTDISYFGSEETN